MKILNIDSYEISRIKNKIEIIQNVNNIRKLTGDYKLIEFYKELPFLIQEFEENDDENWVTNYPILDLYLWLIFDSYSFIDISLESIEDIEYLIKEFDFTNDEIIQMIENIDNLQEIKIYMFENEILKETIKKCNKDLDIEFLDYVNDNIQNTFNIDTNLDDYIYHKKKVKVTKSKIILLATEYTIDALDIKMTDFIKFLEKCSDYNEREEF